ncbi:MAG: proteasome accessory factor PafA2 family protein [Actinomycetaceae bacterium]|nr:proteasome accessory factor PafA2 family protein [Actinomycetaceae bacterium]
MRRVIGIETEYGVLATSGTAFSADALEPEKAARILFRHRPKGYRNDNMFLRNGGRLYLDIGAHPEFASAECSTVAELIANDQSSIILLQDMADAAATDFASMEPSRQLHLFRNNVDSVGNTFGCHENYLISRHTDDERLTSVLGSFLVTRLMLTGAGVVHAGVADGNATQDDPDMAQDISDSLGLTWGYSSRQPFMKATSSWDPTKDRSLINTRDEPHADKNDYRRLHVICGDSNMSVFQTALKFGLTAGVLDVIDSDIDCCELELTDPIAAMAIVNYDAHAPLQLRYGGTASAIDIMRGFIERIRLLGEVSVMGSATAAFLDQAEFILDTVDKGETHLLSGLLDWAIKKELTTQALKRFQERCGERISAEVACAHAQRIDLAYHDICRKSGLVDALRAQDIVKDLQVLSQMPGMDDALDWSLEKAPSTTRAAIRSRFVEACLEKNADHAVTWTTMRLDAPPKTPVDVMDPFTIQDDAAERLIRFVKALSFEEANWIDIHTQPTPS